jgi:glycosyltransferase EpsF
MRVLHIIDSLNMGGAETWLVEMAKYTVGVDRDFPKFDFLVAGGEKAIFDETVIELGCKVHYLKLDKHSTWTFIRGYRKILKENSYIAIHDHQDYLSGWHFLFGLGLLPPVRVVHFHNPYYQLIHNYGVTAGRRMKQRIGRWLMKRLATLIFGTSAKLLEEYNINVHNFSRQQPGALNCAFVLSNFKGVHLRAKEELCRELDWSISSKIMLFAGRLDKSLDIDHPNNHKNSAFAIHVLKECSVDCKMIMVGANEFIKTDILSFIAENDLQERVKLLGVRRDINQLMLAADILLFPSRSEGMGMVAVEAQAAGLPVLASDQVPNEVVVLPGMVDFLPLKISFRDWSEKVGLMVSKRKPTDTIDDLPWQTSPFNMQVCCNSLQKIYLPQN